MVEFYNMYWEIWFNMNEDISIINKNTRNERIKNFFINNKKNLIILLTIIILIVFGYFAYEEVQNKKKIQLAEKYNSISNKFISNNQANIKKDLIEIIYEKDTTYSPLALYFILDNELIREQNKINKYFDIVINIGSLEKEIKNLNIYKKAIYNSNFVEETELVKILRPVTNSNSIWKSHSLFLLAEFFYFKKNKEESKKLLNEIINYENSNLEIKLEAQKKLTRDFSE